MPYAAMVVNQTYENLKSEFGDNQDAHGQIENYKTGKRVYSEDTEPTEQNSQVHKTNLVSGDFISMIATNDEIAANIRSLNKKQRMCYISW